MTDKQIESIEEDIKRKTDEYYVLSNRLENMKLALENIKGRKGHTVAFKQLILAIEGYDQQLRTDHARYVKQIKSRANSSIIKELQTSLNRERKLREKLEVQVKEASESSGLFIRFVRDKLGV